MGLPGSGKTTLARELNKHLPSKWYNADDLRASENDWDFSNEGRIRQALRMKTLAEDSESYGFKYVICDFVAPTENIRNLFDADYIIWMNTINQSVYENTNNIFELPSIYDLILTDFKYSVSSIINDIERKL
jgi:adenylylsulfate kinase